MSLLLSQIYLTNIGLLGCRLEGWETLFKSLTSLKHLALDDTELVGMDSEDIIAQLPSQALQRLEALRVCFKAYPDVSWLEAHFASLPSLRKLAIYSLSPTSLSSLLKHCQKLESLYFVHDCGMPFGMLSCAHLEVFSRVTSPSLKDLVLRNGSFYPESIMVLAASRPPSLKFLKLTGCPGITAESLRALVRLPLSQLTVIGQRIHPKEYQKLKDIIESEEHEVLEEIRFGILSTD